MFSGSISGSTDSGTEKTTSSSHLTRQLPFTGVLINYPIFNVADIYVVVATIGLFILFLFVYKEKDLEFLNFKQNRYREMK